MEPNDDMEGNFLGGGALKHVVSGGEIYLNSYQLAGLFVITGEHWMAAAVAHQDPMGAAAAELLMILSEKIDTLRSEILKREIEASFKIS